MHAKQVSDCGRIEVAPGGANGEVSLGVEAFNISIAISLPIAAIFQIQFSRAELELMLADQVQGEPDPLFVVSDREPAIIDRFLSGLASGRVELHGPKTSSTIMNILGLMASYNDDYSVKALREDVATFGSSDQKAVWAEVTMRDQIALDGEIRALGVFARMQFETIIHDHKVLAPASTSALAKEIQ